MQARYALSEMIPKPSCPFTEGAFIKDCMLKVADIVCPKKLFEGISFAANTVDSRVNKLASYESINS